MIRMLAQDLSDPSQIGVYLVVAAIVIFSFVMLVSVRRKIARRQSDRLTPYERIEKIRQVDGVRDDMRNMMVELNDLTRRFGAQLDAKSMRLEKLLDEAETRIAELERLQGIGAAAPGPQDPGDRDEMAVETPTPIDEPEPIPVMGEPLPDPATARVYQLADEGLSSMEIAQQLDGQVGKVELILALRREGA